MPTLESHNGYYLWQYIPSRPAAILFTILFLLATVAQGWKMFSTRMWFCLPFFIGGIFEVIGYIGRILAYDQTGEILPYILQSVFLLLAPVLFAATLHMIFSRIVRALHADKYSIVDPRWVTRVFVFGDVFSFLIQAGGAGILVKGGQDSNPKMGENIIVGGLVFQVVMFAFFMLTGVFFHMRYGKAEPMAQAVPWRGMLWMLYVTSLFIMVRNIFRIVQYVMGQTGYLLVNEWPTYVFDGALMLFTMLWFLVRYPSQLRTRAEDVYSTNKNIGLESVRGEVGMYKSAGSPEDMSIPSTQYEDQRQLQASLAEQEPRNRTSRDGQGERRHHHARRHLRQHSHSSHRHSESRRRG